MIENNAKIITSVPGPCSQKLLEKRKQYVSGAVYSSANIFIQEAEGALIKDIDGNVYLDFACSSTNIGHCPDEVKVSITNQAQHYIHASFLTIPYEPYIALAERLSELSPIEDGKVILTNSGLYALLDAVRIARGYTGKRGIVFLENDENKELFSDVYEIPGPKYMNKTDGKEVESYMEEQAEYFRKVLEESVCQGGISCIVLEPVQLHDKIIPLNKIYVQKIQKLCEEYHTLLIMDESQSGMARTGALFATEQFGIVPDFLILSRSLATGIPIGCIIGKPHLMEKKVCRFIENGMGGNPLACKAALTVLDNMEKYQLEVRSRALGEYINEFLAKMKERYKVIGSVCGIGALAAIELVKEDGVTPYPEIVLGIIEYCLQKGVIICQPKEQSNCIQLFPSLVMTMEQVYYGMQIIEEAISKYEFAV